jgi:ParB-like chromosome segregation protein Spo0J
MDTKELPFVKKELEVIVLNPMNLPCVDYHKLSILQGSLKTLSEKNRTTLCNSILEHGYFIPAFIWRSGEDMYILDATQRYHALEELERKGYTIPDIPYIEIEAKDKKDAAKKLLQITSRYGEINPETSFFTDFDIDIAYLNDIAIPELDLAFEDLDS